VHLTGQDNQATVSINTSLKVDKANKKCNQQIVGSFLYYARTVHPTIIMALFAIASQWAAPTQDTHNLVNQFLKYIATHPNAKIQYCAFNMILNVQSDVLYLRASNARSHAGGFFSFGSTPCDGSPVQINAPVHVTCAQFSKWWLPLLLKQSLMHSSLMHKKPKSSGLSLKNLVIHNQQLPSTLTTPQLLALLPTPSSNNGRALWKWSISGSLIVKLSISFGSIINPAKIILATTLPNITQLTFINMFAHIMFTCTTLQHFFLELQTSLCWPQPTHKDFTKNNMYLDKVLQRNL
jgi:hypothetical protein